MTRRVLGIGSVLAALLFASGCGPSGDSAKEPPMSDPSPSSTSPSGSTSTGDATATAVADLATRLDVDPSAVEVVSNEAVTWRDGSLGCAKPGMSYTQALVEGARITLRVDGKDYEYHSSGTREPFWCEEPTQ